MKNKALKEKRVELGLTQLQVAKLTGISERAYQNYESGERIPNVVVAIQIADILECDVKDIFIIPNAQTSVNND